MPEIKPNEVYTTQETEELLKVSNSTLKRLIKKGLLHANKIGGQYRIMGHELLRMLSPEIDEKATKAYQHLKSTAKRKVEKWE
jgi:excisionase family DNA binding protein